MVLALANRSCYWKKQQELKIRKERTILEDREGIVHRYEGSNRIETEAGSFSKTLLNVLKDTSAFPKSFSRIVRLVETGASQGWIEGPRDDEK